MSPRTITEHVLREPAVLSTKETLETRCGRCSRAACRHSR